MLTWNNSLEYAKSETSYITDENVSSVIDFFEEFGAWDRGELEDMARSDELEALLVQL